MPIWEQAVTTVSPVNEVYLEFHQIGQQIKVMAIDAQTGVEVSVFGPSSTPQSALERLALQKLKRRMEREKLATSPERGIVV